MKRILERVRGRRTGLDVQARHFHSPRVNRPSRQPAGQKKRDISTSFRRGPIPRPLTTPQQSEQQQEEEETDNEPLLGMPLPAAAAVAALQPSWTSSSSSSSGYHHSREPLVVAAAALTLPALTDVIAAEPMTPPQLGSEDDDTHDPDVEALLWGGEAAIMDPLASMDRVLSSLTFAPITAPPSATAAKKRSSSSSSKQGASTARTSPPPAARSSAVLRTPPSLNTSTTNTSAGAADGSSTQQAPPAAGAAPASSAAGRPASKPKKAPRSATATAAVAAAAAAAPAVTAIHNEADYVRELAAAAAAQQVLVIKIESSRHLLQGGSDSSLRFQTHTSLPTPLNTFLLNNELLGQGMGSAAGAGASSSGRGSGTSTAAEVLQSLGFPAGPSADASGSSAGASSFASTFASSSSASAGEPFSPVHAWYRQLASQYAHAAAAAKRTSPIRFLSLQSDRPQAKAVARRLGASGGSLSVVLVDAASGRRLQEVCGTKIEQELPNGLLYFGGSDPQGRRPADRLHKLSSGADLAALTSSSEVAVVGFCAAAAPPCIRAYARLYAVAQQHAEAPAAALAFGVMDVEAGAEAGAVAGALGLQQLPAFIIYHRGVEVARLSSSPDRKRLGEVLAQHLAAAKEQQAATSVASEA